jgi:dihydrofolate reductase
MSETKDFIASSNSISKDYEIALIVAADTNNAIGIDNQLLWRLPNYLKFFKNTTWGFPVIMGRKTFEAVNKPLPGRTNIVISRNQDWK